MGIVVQKFGGSSVADKERLKQVAEHVIKEVKEGNKVVVVVSAQGKTTDRLIYEEQQLSLNANSREHDALVSVGEQITTAKLAILLEELGYKAVSLLGWQIPIITTSDHINARIKYINNETILNHLNNNKIVVVAGFQGIDENFEITTLGRGGSDTTAVAIASSLKADKCDIYTDVDGVFSVDPRLVEKAKKVNNISYDEMLELSTVGAKVLHNRCVEIGQKFNIPIYVKSTFEEESHGTMVCEKSEIENLYISGVAKEDNISQITVIGINNKPEFTYKLFELLKNENINIDSIAQTIGDDKTKNISFAVKNSVLVKTVELLEDNKVNLNFERVEHLENLSKVSIVGAGMINKPGVSAQFFEILYKNNIDITMISASEIRISVLVSSEKADLAVEQIHNRFFN